MPTNKSIKRSTTTSTKKRPPQLRLVRRFSARQYVLVAVLLLILGVIIYAVRAGSPSWEAETWTKSGTNMKTISDSGASGGAALQFTQTTTTTGGEDVRGVTSELPIYATPSTLISQWLEPRSFVDPGRDEGAFRFQCKPSHLKYDDPIVYPGKPGAAHLHLFYGNDTADANSTYASLRNNGTGTCEGGVINRSSYWIPALLNGSGKVILPDYVQVYYKAQKSVVPSVGYVPRGLRMIAGNPMDSGATEDQVYGPRNTSVPGGYYRHPIWKCYADGGLGVQRNESDVIPRCQDGDALFSSVSFPYCWDKRLDSNDHRTHVVFPRDYDEVCPPTHPYRIPEFTIITKWSLQTGDAAQMSNWFLSSDRHDGMVMYPNGKSMHADWLGAWDDGIMKRWVDTCLKGVPLYNFKSSNNANLCDGQGGKKPTVPVNGTLVPWYDLHPSRLVDVPPKP